MTGQVPVSVTLDPKYSYLYQAGGVAKIRFRSFERHKIFCAR